MTGWLDLPLLALDTESTGIDPTEARIVQVSMVASPGPGLHDAWTRVVNPGVSVPSEAAAVHGYTDERVREVGSDPEGVLAEVLDTLESVALHGIPVVAHNAAYDLTLLDREFRRHLGTGLPAGLIVLDTLCLFRRFDWTTGGRSLGKLAERHGIVFPAHDAEADALASLRLLHILAGMNDVLPLIEPTALYEAQIGWWAQQQDIAEANALGNGNHFTRQPHWPLIPMEEA